jgi:hypothetical protein
MTYSLWEKAAEIIRVGPAEDPVDRIYPSPPAAACTDARLAANGEKFCVAGYLEGPIGRLLCTPAGRQPLYSTTRRKPGLPPTTPARRLGRKIGVAGENRS